MSKIVFSCYFKKALVAGLPPRFTTSIFLQKGFRNL